MEFTIDELIAHRQGIVNLAQSTFDKYPSPANEHWLDRQMSILNALKRLKELEPKETP